MQYWEQVSSPGVLEILAVREQVSDTPVLDCQQRIQRVKHPLAQRVPHVTSGERFTNIGIYQPQAAGAA